MQEIIAKELKTGQFYQVKRFGKKRVTLFAKQNSVDTFGMISIKQESQRLLYDGKLCLSRKEFDEGFVCKK